MAPPVALRLTLLALCSVLAAVRAEGRAIAWIVAFACIAVSLSLWRTSRTALVVALCAESALLGVAVLGTGGSQSPMSPYLLAPAFAAGGATGPLIIATLPALVAAIVLAAGWFVTNVGESGSDYTVASLEWVLLALAVGLISAWSKRVLAAPGSRPEPDDSYVAAYRLLSQLRTVARQLSAGLDAAGLAQSILTDIRALVPYDRAAVFVRGSGDGLVTLVHASGDHPGWAASITDDSPFADAWMSQQARWRRRPLTPGIEEASASAVIPLRIGVRTFGLVALEWLGGDPGSVDRAAVQHVTDEASLRLGTALLFDELREIATVEERRRLAREIHDGIAQELASWGYLLDGMVAESRDLPIAEDLAKLRQELTRVISEIRLSIFDLRSEVDQHGGLGAALSEYVRSVGASSTLRVHLSLDEGPARLPADVEAELLRIAQEAITNARKHAHAENLWVDCVVYPPRAELRVTDDGVGLQKPREDSFGLEIMKERAGRLRARLSVTSLEGGGTEVHVVVGDTPPRR